MKAGENVTNVGYVSTGKNVLEDSIFNPIPRVIVEYRDDMLSKDVVLDVLSPIILVNNIDDCPETKLFNLHFRKIGSLDFWNEISGFIHTNVNAGHELYDFHHSGIEIPEDMKSIINPDYSVQLLGAIFIDSDYDVYICDEFDEEAA